MNVTAVASYNVIILVSAVLWNSKHQKLLKNIGKNRMKGTEEDSFLPFAFFLIIWPDDGLHRLCLPPCKHGMHIQGIIIGAWKLVIAVSVFEGHTWNHVLATHFSCLPQKVITRFPAQHAEWGASWARWL